MPVINSRGRGNFKNMSTREAKTRRAMAKNRREEKSRQARKAEIRSIASSLPTVEAKAEHWAPYLQYGFISTIGSEFKGMDEKTARLAVKLAVEEHGMDPDGCHHRKWTEAIKERWGDVNGMRSSRSTKSSEPVISQRKLDKALHL